MGASDGPRGRGGDYEELLAEKELPHNLEAEQSVLGALLVDVTTSMSAFQILVPDDFYSARHAHVFNVFRDLYDRHQTLDEVMAVEELRKRGLEETVGGMAFLEELVRRVPATANVEHYVRIVREKSILRSLLASCGRIVQNVFDSGVSAREKLDFAEEEILKIGSQELGRDFVPLSEVLEEQYLKLGLTGAVDEQTIRTGFQDLDELTTGFHAGDLVIVAGRPSMGKTSFCLNCVERAALEGKKVAVFSLEVSKEQLVQNVLCSYCRVDAQRLRQRRLSTDGWEKLHRGAERLANTQVYIDDTPGLTPLALKSKARRLRDRSGLDLLVIDYLQLMEVEGQENRQQEIAKVSRSLKALAKELSIPVIAISQLSRGVESRESERHRPRLSDLRESGAIEQDADLVLLLYREEYYYPEKEEAKGKAEVIVAKQRHGPTGSVQLTFLGPYLRFENFAPPYGEFGLGEPDAFA